MSGSSEETTLTIKGWAVPEAILRPIGGWYALATGVGDDSTLDLTARDLGAVIVTPWQQAEPGETVTFTVPAGIGFGVVVAGVEGGPPNVFVHISQRLYKGQTFSFQPRDLVVDAS